MQAIQEEEYSKKEEEARDAELLKLRLEIEHLQKDIALYEEADLKLMKVMGQVSKQKEVNRKYDEASSKEQKLLDREAYDLKA